MLGNESIDMEVDLANLDLYIKTIRESKLFGKVSPLPTAFPTCDLMMQYESRSAVEELMKHARRSMLDKIGFLNWWLACAPNTHIVLGDEACEEYSRLAFSQYAKRGVLVNLSRDWQQLNFPVLVRHDVPVFYPWTATESGDERFGRLDPSVLSAYHAFYPGGVESTSAKLPLWDINFPQLSHFSHHLEREGQAAAHQSTRMAQRRRSISLLTSEDGDDDPSRIEETSRGTKTPMRRTRARRWKGILSLSPLAAAHSAEQDRRQMDYRDAGG